MVNEVLFVGTGKSKFSALEFGEFEILGSTSVIGYDNSYDYEGDFILTARVGANAGELYRHSGKVKISDNTVFIQGDGLDFIFYILQHFDIKKLSFGTGQPLVKASELKELKILMPVSVKERNHVGTFFSTLDRHITLHQRKLDKLKSVKQAYLSEMFPAEGERVPKRRFPGFTDDWELRKLSEFVSFYNGLTYSPNDVNENGTLVLRSSNVKDGEVVVADNVYVDTEKVTSENVKVGDIVVVVRNGSKALIGKHAVIKESMPNTVIGAFMSGIRTDIPFFVNALLDTKWFEKEIEKNMGATINQITGYMFSNMEFIIPSIAEQSAIGTFFSTLDRHITLHQRKSI